MGYAEILMDDAVQGDRGQRTDDLQRILDASRNLHRLILSLLDPATIHRAAGSADLDEYRRTLRHDLRTPINAIKGYGEMLREDAAGGGEETLVADLDKLLSEATLLLDRIDGLVTFSGGDPAPSDGTDPSAEIGARERMVESSAEGGASDHGEGSGPCGRAAEPDSGGGRQCLEPRASDPPPATSGAYRASGRGRRQRARFGRQRVLDLVLLDLMMPGISGYDVLASLKSNPRFREIPVIMISALSELDSIVRCIEAGADDYLAKPFDPTLLRARVGSSLEKKHLRDREREMIEALRVEKERSEQLLLNILPQAIVSRLNGGETVIADQLLNVTILFADLVGFTKLSSRLSAGDLVRLLNGLFSEFDRLALDLGVEKIKTVGDAYMVAGGLPEPRVDHAHAVADMALAMVETIERMNRELPMPLQMRIGIHSGDVVAGVIGTHKFVYDIWGDAVNIASRMESHSLPNRIQISAATRGHLHESFRLEPHGSVDVKGKGLMETYFLLGRARAAIA